MKRLFPILFLVLMSLSFVLGGCSDKERSEGEFVIGQKGGVHWFALDFVDAEGNSLLDRLEYGNDSGRPVNGEIVETNIWADGHSVSNPTPDIIIDPDGKRWLLCQTVSGYKEVHEVTTLLTSHKIFGDMNEHEVKSYWKKMKDSYFRKCTGIMLDGIRYNGVHRMTQFGLVTVEVYYVTVPLK